MNDLDEIQAFFAAQLTTRRALPNDVTISAQARSIIASQGALSPVERLEIYREQFWLRHTSSLVEDFPGVSGILGQGAWQKLIEGYLDAHPPRSFTLRDLGLRFPDYVASQTQLDHRELCSDMARLELAYLEIFDAADAPPISQATIADIAESAWKSARVEFQPALRVLQVGYPVAALRRALIDAHGSVAIPAPERQFLLVFRRDLQLFYEQLSASEYALLEALLRGVPLVPACEQLQQAMPVAAATLAEDVGAWFQSWATRGFITGVAEPVT